MRFIVILGVLAAICGAQPTFKTIKKAEVSATLKFLCDDALGGRDTPSPGLEKAQLYLVERFQSMGLEPGMPDGSWSHAYKSHAQLIPLRKCSVELAVKTSVNDSSLIPGQDFRIYKAPPAYVAKQENYALLSLDKAAAKGLWNGRPINKPLMIETPPDSLLWRSCAGDHSFVKPEPNLNAPIILVRPGIVDKTKLTCRISLAPAEKGEIELKNVVGLLRGREKPEEYVFMTAHYDHVGVGIPKQGDAIYNGADDNATGTTSVVEVAAAFTALSKQQRPARSIFFVCFSGEERGLLGSYALVKDPPVPLEKIAAVVNIEMLGRPAKGKKNYAWVTGRKHSNFEAIARKAFKRAKIQMIKFPMAEALYSQSDNYPFAKKGIVAHSISAGYLHPDYHQPGDEFDKINLKHMTKVINGLCQVVYDFANRSKWPTKK